MKGNETEASSGHAFTGLVPGAGYNVSVWAEVGDASTSVVKSEVMSSGANAVYTGKMVIDFKAVAFRRRPTLIDFLYGA